MQSDQTILWQSHPKQPCQSCGAMADYMTLGHMYRVHCATCDREELGMFSPPVDPNGMPARPFDVFIDCANVKVSADNMFKLAKLHKSLNSLKPVELKALIAAGKQHFVGQLPLWELEQLQSAAAGTAFDVVAHQSDQQS